MEYKMCPECYVVFFKSEIDTFVVGIHMPKCSEPKLRVFTEDRDEEIKKLEEHKAFQAKFKR